MKVTLQSGKNLPQHIWLASQRVCQRWEIGTIQGWENGHRSGLEQQNAGGTPSQSGHFCKDSEETGGPQESILELDRIFPCHAFTSIVSLQIKIDSLSRRKKINSLLHIPKKKKKAIKVSGMSSKSKMT